MMATNRKRILIVDDDPAILSLLTALLHKEYELAVAATGEEALDLFAQFRPDLVMLDILLPGMNGIEVCRQMRSTPAGQDIQIMMVSGCSSREERTRAYEAGADDYLVKPFDPHGIDSRVRLHFRISSPADAIVGPDLLAENTSVAQPNDIPAATVAVLTKVAEFRDSETGEHLVRVRSYSQIIAEQLGQGGPYADQIDEQFLNDIFHASPLHDIGKIGISDAILLKPDRLSAEEFEAMKQHTSIGGNILEHVTFAAPNTSFVQMGAAVARFHHEKFDGSGYPIGLSGTMIPLSARIVALADAFDAMTSNRPYQKARSLDVAREIVKNDAGSHFDPVIVEAFLNRFPMAASVHKRIKDSMPLVIGAHSVRPEYFETTAD